AEVRNRINGYAADRRLVVHAIASSRIQKSESIACARIDQRREVDAENSINNRVAGKVNAHIGITYGVAVVINIEERMSVAARMFGNCCARKREVYIRLYSREVVNFHTTISRAIFAAIPICD